MCVLFAFNYNIIIVAINLMKFLDNGFITAWLALVFTFVGVCINLNRVQKFLVSDRVLLLSKRIDLKLAIVLVSYLMFLISHCIFNSTDLVTISSSINLLSLFLISCTIISFVNMLLLGTNIILNLIGFSFNCDNARYMKILKNLYYNRFAITKYSVYNYNVSFGLNCYDGFNYLISELMNEIMKTKSRIKALNDFYVFGNSFVNSGLIGNIRGTNQFIKKVADRLWNIVCIQNTLMIIGIMLPLGIIIIVSDKVLRITVILFILICLVYLLVYNIYYYKKIFCEENREYFDRFFGRDKVILLFNNIDFKLDSICLMFNNGVSKVLISNVIYIRSLVDFIINSECNINNELDKIMDLVCEIEKNTDSNIRKMGIYKGFIMYCKYFIDKSKKNTIKANRHRTKNNYTNKDISDMLMIMKMDCYNGDAAIYDRLCKKLGR